MLQDADVGGRAADIDNCAVSLAGEKGCAAHRVRRTGGKGRHRVALRVVDAHERAVVLGEEDRRIQRKLGESGVECLDDPRGKLAEAGVHDRGVLSFQEAGAADLVREADLDPGQLPLEDRRRLFLELPVDRREDRGDGDRAEPFLTDVRCHRTQLVGVQGRDRTPVELVPAVAQVDVVTEGPLEALRPVDERRKRGRRGQAEADGRRRHQVLGLDHRVREVRGPDHHGLDVELGFAGVPHQAA